MKPENIRNFVIIAHVDHGKSTLADRFLELTGTVEKRELREQFLDQMDLERERGITIKMQPVRMLYEHQAQNRRETMRETDAKLSRQFGVEANEVSGSASVSRYVLNLIDTPGHVDFSYEVSRSLAAVEGAILLVDATQGIQAQTLANFRMAREEGLRVIGALSKIDLRPEGMDDLGKELASLIGVPEGEIHRVSGKTGEGVEALLSSVIEKIPSPSGESEKPLRALIFDSHYNPYKGVIAYVKIVEGRIRRGERIFLWALRQTAEAGEVGIFRPKLIPEEELTAGAIGYIATGIKDPGSVRVGDTITKPEFAERKLGTPLAGYREPTPMVFANFYPRDAKDLKTLKDALGKLKLNDAALTFEETYQEMLGQGMRLGFLGTLHLEIVKERLRREYEIEPIITIPSVLHRAHTRDRGIVDIHTPFELPPEHERISILEPWADAEILTPPEHVGPILSLIQNRRGKTNAMENFGRELLIRFEIPLAEVIGDFYDTLKSVSRGYASLHYGIADWRVGDLVKVDIRVTGDVVEAFSRILPRQRAETWGRATIERLKEILPRELFPIPIQATIGSRVIARVTMPALKKDVTGYLYGGDRTRKMKLWKKQQRGKKKLAGLGSVEIPPSTFFEIFKVKSSGGSP